MSEGHSIMRPQKRRRLATFGALALLGLCVSLALAAPSVAGSLTGGFAPVVLNGGADVNGSGVVNGRDDSNAFYGDTSIIDGKLDCDSWAPIANAGTPGDEMIDENDDCDLVAYDGTIDGVTINVEDGVFQVDDGRLPGVFNALDPDNPDIGDSDFAWSAIDGRVDSDGDETISADDCHFGLVGVTRDAGLGDATDGYDVLGNDGSNTCGFGSPPSTADNGLVDLNDDADITAADSCVTRCFFGHNIVAGKVQELQCPGFVGDPRNQVVGTPGSDVLVGTGGRDVICGLGGNDVIIGKGGRDLGLGGGGRDLVRGGARGDVLRGGRGADVLRGGRGPDRLFGGRGNDRLNGGRGFDTCVGGSGRDTSVRCENH